MTTIHYAPLATALLLLPMTLPANAADGYLTPSAYFSRADSPIEGDSLAVFHLEDFEDGLLNTPGVSTTTPGIINGPSDLTDSVDGDAGPIDGNGAGGKSLLTNGFTTFAFNFDATVLGGLPTHVGVVWTDVGSTTSTPGKGTVEFEAFDALSASLGVLTATDLGDGSPDGRTNATAEDRFLGAIFSSGISRIEIRMPTSADWELDHLQYGVAAVPLPATVWLFGGALTLLGAARRRR